MTSIRLHITNPQWAQTQSPGQLARGTAFLLNEKRAGAELAQCLPSADASANEWKQALNKLNGFFAVVAQTRDILIAAVDRVRSIPLFYGQKDDQFFLSDDAEWVRQQLGDEEMDPIAREEFQLAGYVTGRDSLYPNLKQLQAGEWLRVEVAEGGLSIITGRYYRFLHSEPATYDEPRLREQLDSAAERSVQRVIDYADGRQIVIPLSGGYDSRLIATLLKRLDYGYVLAFTYGVPGNKESQYSKQVADTLGLKWHFIEYSESKWRETWQSKERIHYQRWGSGWSSLPHVQDWLAVRELKRNGVVDPDCIFTPGHTGDFISGGHIPEEAQPGRTANSQCLPACVQRKHYALAPLKNVSAQRHEFWGDRIVQRAEISSIGDAVDLANAFEKWEWQERQAKFIINSVRVYEFFGYDWWLPLWDAEFMAFWQRVPLELRNGKAWYVDYVRRSYSQLVGGDGGKLRNATMTSNAVKFMKLLAGGLGKHVYNVAFMVHNRKKIKSHMSNPYNRLCGLMVSDLERLGYRINGIDAFAFLKDIPSRETLHKS